MEWVQKYGLSAADLIRHKVGWSNYREQLIYQFYGEPEELIFWQARNFRKGTDHKNRFYTSGKANDVVAYYPTKQGKGTTACIVEDCISAMVVSHGGAHGVPCFGAAMSQEKLARLAKLFHKVFVWLDSDKMKESHKIARQLGMLGVRTRVLYTKEDPKCYPLDYVESLFKVEK